MTDIFLQNSTNSSKQILVKAIYTEDNEAALRRDVGLGPHEGVKFNNKVVMGSSVDVTVDAESGASGEYDWNDPTQSLHITVSSGGIGFRKESYG